MRSYFEVEGRKVYPVETSAYQTVNFSKDENIILATTGLSGCYAILIKSRDVATMVHYNPQNFIGLGGIKSRNIVAEIADNISVNLQFALQDFLDKGGDQSNMIISIYGGLMNTPYIDFLTKYFKDQKFQYKFFSDSQNKAPSPFEITSYSNVFLTKDSVMVTRTFDRVQLNSQYHNHILIREASKPSVSEITPQIQSVMQQTSIDFVDLKSSYANYCLDRTCKLLKKQRPLRLVDMNKIFEKIHKQEEVNNSPSAIEDVSRGNKILTANDKLDANVSKDDTKDLKRGVTVKTTDRSNNQRSQSNLPSKIMPQKRSDDLSQTSYDYLMIGALCSASALLFYLWYKYNGDEVVQDSIADESWASLAAKGYEGERGF